MKKKYLRNTLAVVVVLIAVFAVWYLYELGRAVAPRPVAEDDAFVSILPDSPLDTQYTLGEDEVVFVAGMGKDSLAPYEMVVANDSIDHNSDGRPDAIVYLFDAADEGIATHIGIAIQDTAGWIGGNLLPLGTGVATSAIVVEEGLIELTTVQRYFIIRGALLHEYVPTDGISIVRGELTKDENDAYTLTNCAGETRVVDPDSRAYAALRTIYTERIRTQEHDAVWLVAAGTNSKVDTFIVDTILAAPRTTTCGQ